MDDIQALLDKQAIAEVLADYARGADRIDVDLLTSVFHPDAEADYGAMFTGTGHEFAAFLATVHPTMEAHHHQLGNMTIRVEGDRAGSETYVSVRLRTRSESGVPIDIASHGRYVDRWERREGRWRIAHRRYLHDLDEMWESRGGAYESSGARNRDDPSYAVLRPGELTDPR